MTRLTRWRVLVVGLLALPALAACSSSGSSDDGGTAGGNLGPVAGVPDAGDGADPSVDAKPSDSDSDKIVNGSGGGTIHYSGAENGAVTFGSVSCGVVSGKLAVVTAPDKDVQPDATVTLSVLVGNGNNTTISFRFGKGHSYLTAHATGVKADKKEGSWTMTFTGTKLDSTKLDGNALILMGTLICGRTDSV